MTPEAEQHRIDLEAQAFARRLVKREARNFYFGFLLLPRRKRRAVYALYSFCRILDDAVDLAAGDLAGRTALKDRFTRMIRGAEPLEGEDRLASVALRRAAAEFPLSRRQLDWIVDGVLMDCAVTRYPTMADLRKYLFGVASAVGLACIEVFRYRSPLARRSAVYLGYAMQLTNIIRDVREDYERGRIYLPLEDLARFEVAEAELGEDRTSPAVRRLLAYEATRARGFFEQARPLWPLLARDAAACPYALYLIYRALLDGMARSGFSVLEGRYGLPSWRKLTLMVRAQAAFVP